MMKNLLDLKLLDYMITNKYKVVIDACKIQILDALIKLADQRILADGSKVPALTKYDLFLIRDGIDKLREKEKKAEAKALATVITNLAKRGNSEVVTDLRDKPSIPTSVSQNDKRRK
jgi:hypothetical protein